MLLYIEPKDKFIHRISFHHGYLGRQLLFSPYLVQQGIKEQR